jgi:hypothetical protein
VRRHAKAFIAVPIALVVAGLFLGTTVATAAAPAVSEVFASRVGPSNAKLNATINPEGDATTYRFEYVDETRFQVSGFGEAVSVPSPDATVGAGSSGIQLSEIATGLSPATRYHYRVVAINVAETVTTAPKAFETFSSVVHFQPGDHPGAGFLSDNRAWEMVTPPDKNGGAIRASSPLTVTSLDGNRLGYFAAANFGNTQGTGIIGNTQYVAIRDGAQWESTAITPTPNPAINQTLLGVTLAWYSSDLKRAVLTAYELPQVDGDLEGNPFNLYRETFATAAIEPLTSPLAGPVFPFTQNSFMGGSADFGQIAFFTTANLVPSASGSVPKVYLWDEGNLHLASILPDGSVPSEGASATASGNGASRETISTDGSRVLFISPPEGPEQQLYMRKDHTDTAWISQSEGSVPVATPADVRYEMASADLRTVVFSTSSALTDDDPGGAGFALYAFNDSDDPDGDTNLEFITRATDGRPAVDGMSPDASRGFFFAEGVQRLYRWDSDGVELVLNGAPSDLDNFRVHGFDAPVRVSADARRIAFVDDWEVTENALGNKPGFGKYSALFVYDVATEGFECASCPPTGATTESDVSIYPEGLDAFGTSVAAPRFLTQDGSAVFFTTADPLVPEDTNGQRDAYEYDVELNQAHLLSSGRSGEESWFAEASPDGRDVFFITTEPLSGWDVDAGRDIYNARAGGGLPEPPPDPPGCEGDACQPPPVVLNDPTPSSAVFNGPGDPTARKVRRRARCGKGTKRRNDRCVSRGKRRSPQGNGGRGGAK